MIPQLNDLVYFLTGRTASIVSPELNVVAVALLVLLTAFFCPRRFFKLQRLSYLRPLETMLNRFARRRGAAIAVVGVLALALNAALSVFGYWPLPAAHDEFSYLLAADTFSHWRLTNPTPALWQHFESFHIILQPTYMSKYPPGQGLMLAAGQIFFGHAIVGSWLGTAFACMAICWALQQWLPPRIAFLGGLLAIAHPVILMWTQSYWGSQLALAGGALAVGAWALLMETSRKVSLRAAWIFGLGCGLMLITRPYEGTALTTLLLLFWAQKMRRTLFQDANRKLRVPVAALPITLCFFFTIAFWGYYNYRVTGNATKMPYVVHHQTYGVSPLMIWEPFHPIPIYHHAEMRRFHALEEPPAYLRHRTPDVLWRVSLERIGRLLILHSFSLALGAGVLLAPLVYRRDAHLRVLFWIAGGFLAALLLEVWLMPHYVAPAVTVAFIISLQGWRRLRAWRWHGRPAGLFLARATMALSFLSLLTSSAQLVRPDSDGLIFTTAEMRDFARMRARVASQLAALPGKDLVIVHYAPLHPTGNEWVYNDADIDAAKTVWARAMTPREDVQLIHHFQNRSVWRLDVDAKPPRLQRIYSR